MKVLFSRYNHSMLWLESIAFALGFTDDLSDYICRYLGIKGRPRSAKRKFISTQEMIRLTKYVEHLTNNPHELINLLCR